MKTKLVRGGPSARAVEPASNSPTRAGRQRLISVPLLRRANVLVSGNREIAEPRLKFPDRLAPRPVPREDESLQRAQLRRRRQGACPDVSHLVETQVEPL